MSPDLVEILRCPVTHEELRRENGALVSTRTGRRYPFRAGTPVLLADEPAGAAGVLAAFSTRAASYHADNYEQDSERSRRLALAGERLTPIPHVDTFWFAWAAFYPGSST